MTVSRSEERTWIEAVQGFGPGEFASSTHGTQARILQVLGESLTYADLICYGAFAFRIGTHKQMCPSAAHPCCGVMCIDNSNLALPWKGTFYQDFPWSPKRNDEERMGFEEEVRHAVVASIDRGIPVIYVKEEDGLIIGYGDEGRRWWCTHPYHKWGKEAFWFDEADGFAGGKEGPSWGFVVLNEPKTKDERTPPRDLFLTALRQAVSMWNTPASDGEYDTGDAAYAFWLEWLRSVETGNLDTPTAGMQGNGWYYDVLTHCRRIAAAWLRQKAEEYPDARQPLLDAAQQYQQLTAQCMADIDCPWSLCPGPDKVDSWTSDMRQQEITRLETARAHDRAAIAALELALSALQ